ncbi:MAG: hypothetical protein ABI559_13790 [Chloroflexota bacterium]
MTKVQTWAIGGVSMAALVAGALLGTGAMTSAQTTTTTPVATAAAASPTPAAASPTPVATSGTFQSNEDATHEANETPEQEAAEDSGQFRGGHGGQSNEDPTHEANESAEREAQEDATAAASPTPGA